MFDISELQLPHRITIQTLSSGRDSGGGNSQTWTTVATNVACLISQTNGNRDGRHDLDGNVFTGTLVGGNAYIGRADVRFYVTVGPRTGRYLRVTGCKEHGPVQDIVNAFYRATVEDLVT